MFESDKGKYTNRSVNLVLNQLILVLVQIPKLFLKFWKHNMNSKMLNAQILMTHDNIIEYLADTLRFVFMVNV